jgi:hypothetical protein
MWVRGTNSQTTRVRSMNQQVCRSRDGGGGAALVRGLRALTRWFLCLFAID